MSDPLGKDVSPGDPIEFRADTFNLMMRSARRERDREYGNRGSAAGGDLLVSGVRVLVRNDTATDLNVFSILKLGDPILDATDADLVHDLQANPIFPGTTPGATTDPFVVTLTPLPDGETGAAVLLGVVVCDIEVSDAAHGYAVPGVVTTKLTSAANGPAKVIWKESGTGTKRALVLMCGQIGATGATGGTITVEEQDGAPSVASVATLRFDQADGFVVSTPGAGSARVDLSSASTTQKGAVDTAAQSFAGLKNFTDGAKGDFFEVNTGTSYGYLTSISGYNESGYTFEDGIGLNDIASAFLCVESSVGRYVFMLRTDSTNGAYALRDNSASYVGQYGSFTTADGKTVTVKGGIITSIV